MNLANNLERSAFFFPERPAVSVKGVEITYAELNDRAGRVATSLIKMGVKPGDYVGLCAPNSADWIAFYFGVLKAGAVAVTISPLLTRDELANLINHVKPKIIFADPVRLGDIERLRDSAGLEKIICPDGDLDMQTLLKSGSGSLKALNRNRTDTAAVLYTGGTTGVPKGVMLTHENITFSSWSIAYHERSTEIDRALCFLPFNHVFGQIHIMNATIMSGGCLELLPSFDMERVLEAMEAGRVTKFFAVPTIYVRLLTVGDLEKKLGKVRYCFSAAASISMEIVKQWKERTGITISESYGMTEAMPVTYNHYYRHVVGSVGQVVHGVEVQIRDTSGNILGEEKEGEICIRGPNVMKAYLNNQEETRSAFWAGGWLRSGDIGFFDRNGYLYVVDRIKDLIITGGENVYPREVEEVIYTRPEVEECAVVGFPDREWGERVTAFIKPRKDCSISPEELKSFLKSCLAPFKVPKEYIVVSDIPKSSTGKVLKRELKKQIPETC
ncbi:MAG: AMP-binding protein [Armatimonadetes bacterium]|nr:AMP-binding protein [Armatimonadota bacterium]